MVQPALDAARTLMAHAAAVMATSEQAADPQQQILLACDAQRVLDLARRQIERITAAADFGQLHRSH